MTPTDQTPAAPETMETITRYLVHPAALLIPEPSAEDYARLKADIKQHGLRVPIILTPTGEILDGRTRAQICDELGIDYTSGPMHRHTRTATHDEMEDPVATVLALNAARRHLTGDQIIALYLQANADQLEADKQAAKVTQKANLKQGSTRPEKSTMSLSGEILPGETAASKIAKAIGKSASAVKRVRRVQKVAPEKMPDVITGRTSAAKILKQEIPGANEDTPTAAARGGKKTTGTRTKAAATKAKPKPPIDKPQAEPKTEAVDEDASEEVAQLERWVTELEEVESEYITPDNLADLKACHRRIGALIQKVDPGSAAPDGGAGDPGATEQKP